MTEMTDEAKRLRDRTLSLTEDAADLLVDLHDRLFELAVEVGADAKDVHRLVCERLEATEHQKLLALFYPVWREMFPRADQGTPIERVIRRLFREAPQMMDAKGRPTPDQAPAVECGISLRNGQLLSGVLSTTPEGGLRIMCANQRQSADGSVRPVMIEQFFEWDQVVGVSVIREVKAQASSLVGVS